MRRNRSVFEAVVILAASAALLMTGGVASAVSLKSGPKSAPNSAPNSAPQSAPYPGPKPPPYSAPGVCNYPYPMVGGYSPPTAVGKGAPKPPTGPNQNWDYGSYNTLDFTFTAKAPKSARVGQVVTIEATYKNNGPAGAFYLSSSAYNRCGWGWGNAFDLVELRTGQSYKQLLVLNTAEYFDAGEYVIAQNAFTATDDWTQWKWASAQTGTFRLTGK